MPNYELNPYGTPAEAVKRLHKAVVIFERSLRFSDRLKDASASGSLGMELSEKDRAIIIASGNEMLGIRNASPEVRQAITSHLYDHLEHHPRGTEYLAFQMNPGFGYKV
ncbi:MAG TPA: hypothetical protein VLG67_02605 [Candidatus Saccharimonadales bacterium]|nr:hypothetical protein [Candidatus Saccharimonadales bacterium]